MAAPPVQPTLAEVLAVADRQHGLVTHTQLSALGLTRAAVRHRLRTGRLHAIRRGIYAVGSPRITLRAGWLAAVLACGPGAALSHDTAAALYGIRPARRGRVHVSVAGGRRPRQAGVVVHRRGWLETQDLTQYDNIPVTVIALTLVDLAPTSTRAELERAINEADKHDLIDPEALRGDLDAYPALPGAARLRKELDRHTFTLTESELERAFLPLARRAGLPPPRTGARVNGFKVDFYWPHLRLVVETDGLRYHRTPAHQTADRRRDQAHVAADLTPLRFTHAQVAFEPDHVERTLRAAGARERHGRAA